MDKQKLLQDLNKEGKVTLEPEKVVIFIDKNLDGELGIKVYLKNCEIVYLSRKSSFWQDKI